MMPGVTGSLQRTTDVAAPMNTPDSQAGRPPARPAELGANRIEIVLPDGTCVRVDNQVGAAALRQVIAVLRG
jgi:hypothetical protein